MKAALLAAALCAFPAAAGWEGTLTISQPGGKPVEGRIRVQGGKVRLEQSVFGRAVVTVYDAPGKRLLQLDPVKRTFSERPMPTPRGPPSCAGDVEPCLRALGFEKEPGGETVAGHPCSLWRRGSAERLWRADDVQGELAFLRQETGAVRVDVRAFRVAAQPDGAFTPPPGWKRAAR